VVRATSENYELTQKPLQGRRSPRASTWWRREYS
jgi:hypothetical protein